MEAKELRLGNLVLCDTWDNDYIAEVDAIGSSVSIDLQGDLEEMLSRYHEVRTSEIKPIPLSEEWLLKFGFKKQHNTGTTNEWYWKGLGMDLTPELELSSSDRYYDSMPVDGAIPLQYVHQLQNLYFALTGKELELAKENG